MSEVLKIINLEIKNELADLHNKVGKSDVSKNLKVIESLNKILLDSERIAFLNEKYNILNKRVIYKDDETKFYNLTKYYTKKNFFSNTYIDVVKDELLTQLYMINRIKITRLSEKQISGLKKSISKYIHLALILKYFNGNVDLEYDKLYYTLNKYNIWTFISKEKGVEAFNSKLKIDKIFLENIEKFDFICSIDSNLFNELEFLYNYMNVKNVKEKNILKSKEELLIELRKKESVVF